MYSYTTKNLKSSFKAKDSLRHPALIQAAKHDPGHFFSDSAESKSDCKEGEV